MSDAIDTPLGPVEVIINGANSASLWTPLGEWTLVHRVPLRFSLHLERAPGGEWGLHRGNMRDALYARREDFSDASHAAKERICSTMVARFNTWATLHAERFNEAEVVRLRAELASLKDEEEALEEKLNELRRKQSSLERDLESAQALVSASPKKVTPRTV